VKNSGGAYGGARGSRLIELTQTLLKTKTAGVMCDKPAV
jgi:hypothetical protein